MWNNNTHPFATQSVVEAPGYDPYTVASSRGAINILVRALEAKDITARSFRARSSSRTETWVRSGVLGQKTWNTGIDDLSLYWVVDQLSDYSTVWI